MLDILRHFLREGSILLDVGVNRAQTLYKAKAVCPEVTYIGIEPMPESVAFANTVIKVNEFTNCSVICAALGSKEFDVSALKMRRGSRLDSTAFINFGADTLRQAEQNPGRFESRWILSTTFDALHEVMGSVHIDLAKIDVEGSEREVLEGMRNLLRGSRPVVLLEVLPIKYRDDESGIAGQRAIREILIGEGYELYRILKDLKCRRTRGLEPVGDWPFFFEGNSKHFRDYLAMPEERKSQLKHWIQREAGEGSRP